MLNVTFRYIFHESRAASSAKRLQTMVKRLLFRPFPQIFLLIKHLFPVMYLPLSIGSELTMIGTHIDNFRVIKFFESVCEARRLLAIMCIGFLANHCLCNHPQNHLVRDYQCLFTTFQILFLCT